MKFALLLPLLAYCALYALLPFGGGGHFQQVQCTSSYIDDYFLPTAKLALNKLQQSLAPAIREFQAKNNESETSVTTVAGVAVANKEEAANLSESSNKQQQPQQQVVVNDEQLFASNNKSDPFVSLETRPDGSTQSPSQIPEAQPETEAANTVSSTESASLDPTTGLLDLSISPSKPDETSTTLLAEQISISSNNTNNISDGIVGAKEQSGPQVKSAEDSVRETELEAIAALEATINFGDPFGSSPDNCYDEYGNARFCEPEFENIALDKQVEVSSECGQPPTRFCTAYLNERNDQIRNCHICDSQHPKKRHPASFLTDVHNANNPTCWVSAPIGVGGQSTEANNRSNEPTNRLLGDNVTLTLNFDKKYEIAYVGVQFCSLKPDSLAIYKSLDYGNSYTGYQFYSSQCAKMYNKQQQTGGPAGSQRQLGAPIEASCVNSSSPSSSAAAARVAFSPLESVRAMPDWQESRMGGAGLADWITATGIKIVLDRHQTSWIQSSLAHHRSVRASPSELTILTQRPVGEHQQQVVASGAQTAATIATTPPTNNTFTNNANGASTQQLQQIESSLTNPSETYNYAIADLTVGGRCKCNGHASRCIHAKDGRLQCDCRHNTAGRDCERCAPFHFDRPWQRASQTDANPCQPCQCNGHSRKCRFDAELYQLSGRKSGGVCINCRDNTAGRHCHYCKENFTRDHTRPMSDKEACKPCDCHPVGSLGRVCNQTTGQCPCKEGVTGLECNRCAPGYQQSSSPSEPCIKLPENDINYEPTIEATSEEQPQIGPVPLNDEHEPQIAPTAATGADTPTPSGGLRANSPQQQAPRPASNGESGNELNSNLAPDQMDANANNNDNNRPEGDQENSNNNNNSEQSQFSDEDDDQSDLSGAGAQFVGSDLRPRQKQHHQLQWGQRVPFNHKTNKQHSYYNTQTGGANYRHTTQNGRHFRLPSSLPFDELDDEQAVDLGGNPRENHFIGEESFVAGRQGGLMFNGPQTGGATYYSQKHQGSGRNSYVDYRQLQHSHHNRHQGRKIASGGGQQVARARQQVDGDSLLMPAAKSVQGQSLLDEFGNQGGVNYAQMEPIYVPSEEENFNEIQTSAGHHQLSPLNSRVRQQLGGGRAKQQMVAGASQRHKFNPAADLAEQNPRQLASSSQYVGNCADCQATIRRVNFRQFCNLDYSIKATVLFKEVAKDWTRLAVEIGDIFKSPAARIDSPNDLMGAGTLPLSSSSSSSSSSASSRALPASNNYIDSLQADDPSALMGLNTRNQTATSDNQRQQQQQQSNEQLAGLIDQQQQASLHRLKIGSRQSIWIPTEDINCRCPRLKLHSTYLLMGSMDFKENSANAIQLDRHGIALEWRPSLQERLIKYQRRHSRGRC